MKNKKLWIGLLLCSAFALASCGEKSGGSNNSIPQKPKAEVVNITDSSLTLDCFANYQMEVELNGVASVTWSSSDPSVLSVDQNGLITSNIKQGKATIVATSGEYSDSCTVTVLVKGGIPTLSVKNEAVVSQGDVYQTDVAVYYNKEDITDYVSWSLDTVFGAEYASAEVVDNKLKITGLVEGEAQFSLYTTVFDKVYAEAINVSVKTTDVIFLLRGDNSSGFVLKPGKTMYTSDVEVYDRGNKVENSQLDWSIDDTAIATIGANGLLEYGNEGVTTLRAEYKGTAIAVGVTVEKNKEDHVVEQTEAELINLDMVITADRSTKVRTMNVNQEHTESFQITEDTSMSGFVVRAYVGNNAIDRSCFSFSEGYITVETKVFGLDCYGEHTLRLEVETADTVHTYTMQALIVTKVITRLDDMKNCLAQGWQGDTILGYYTLGMDMDYSWYEVSVWSTDWNYLNGFRATLDGRGYKIKNFKTVNYGITGQIGVGAVFKNIVFANVRYQGNETGIFGRGANSATFENITVYATEDSVFSQGSVTAATGCGLLVPHQTENCTFKNITIHAEGFDIYSLVGGKSAYNLANTFENVNVYANSVEYYDHATKVTPAGITLHVA